MLDTVAEAVQLPLIHVVESDDIYLENQDAIVWFDVLSNFNWRPCRTVAAKYFEALYRFNEEQASQRACNANNRAPNPETEDQATQRLLFERASLCPETPVLATVTSPASEPLHINPNTMRPGTVPIRLAGRKPKCFFAMLKAFLGVVLRGQPLEPQFVCDELESNPAFARTCGFTLPDPKLGYRQTDVPSLRKLEQFDQIMTSNGLWSEIALDQVAHNLQSGRVRPEATVIHDTTHYPAHSGFRTVVLNPQTTTTADSTAPPTVALAPSPAAEPMVADTTPGKPHPGLRIIMEIPEANWKRLSPAQQEQQKIEIARAASNDEFQYGPEDVVNGRLNQTKEQNPPRSDQVQTTTATAAAAAPAAAAAAPAAAAAKKSKRKSQPRTTKSCRCSDRAHCPHPWTSADDGAGTVVKSTGKMIWAHKASTLAFAEQEILLDAVAMTDGATHDSQSVVPHLDRLFQRHPELRGVVNRVLDDAAADDASLKKEVHETFQIELLAPLNTRNRKPIRTNLGRGIDHLEPNGTPVCQQGFPMDFVGCRHDTEHFIFRAPQDVDGNWVCDSCPIRASCCRQAEGPRQATIAFKRLPWIDPQFPQLSLRFAKVMKRRTVIERLHKLMKYDYGDTRLHKRGNKSFQALLDKTLWAMHVVIAMN